MKVVVVCISLSLDDEQCCYSSRDGMIGCLGVQMCIGNKGAFFYIFL